MADMQSPSQHFPKPNDKSVVHIGFLDTENIGIDSRTLTLCALDPKLLVKIDRNGGHFGKWLKCRVLPNIFLGNMPNIIQTGPLKK